MRKPAITGKWNPCYSDGRDFVIWYCSVPGTPKPPITGVGLTPALAYKRWAERFFCGVMFAALRVQTPPSQRDGTP